MDKAKENKKQEDKKMMKTWILYDGEIVEGISTVKAESKTDALKNMCEMLNNDSEVYNYMIVGEEIYQYEGEVQNGDDPVRVYDVEEYEEGNKMTREQELAEEIRNNQEWDLDKLKELCELADMEAEWEAADGENFEAVAFKAAEKLGVEIM